MGGEFYPAVGMTEWDTYYIAGLEQFVMRGVSDNPFCLISNHLISTSLVVDATGVEVARQCKFLRY